ncbi:MAG: hydantoinase B/oxoprolinase family protein [Candidatus Binatia bacterium]
MATEFNAVQLELFNNRLAAVAEEMGAVLGQAGFSPNIKERRDFSCAVLDANGEMVTHAAHIPVHVGSTPLSVKAAISATSMTDGDVVILNDPYQGGTHLPDVTMVAPVFMPSGRSKSKPFAYVANRAHHADIGGISPGSMTLSTNVHQEGLRIPPVHLCRRGDYVEETLALFLANTRVGEERLGDIAAQVAALRVGVERMIQLCSRYRRATVTTAMDELQAYSMRLVRSMVSGIPPGSYQAEDFLDGDGTGTENIRIALNLTVKGRELLVDFRDSDDQVQGPMNANLAVTTSAVFYVVACLAGGAVPANRGMMKPVTIRTRAGSVVDCRYPAAVAGGNVETSQRIVDVLIKALAQAIPERMPAASAGSMTNIALGGHDSTRGRFFSYYETVAGGAGAGPTGPGCSAIQTHMTNTLNTPVEVLECYYPLKVLHYRLRRASGGRGLHRGGNGIDRKLEVLVPAELTLIGERRAAAPWGLAGGENGSPGRDTLTQRKRSRRLEAKSMVRLAAGDQLRVQTPGGGGWGKPSDKKNEARSPRRPRASRKS